MAFWSSQKIKAEQIRLKDLIDPFDATKVQQGAYELALSDQALTTPDFESSKPNPPVDGVLMIEPGQFGLLYTKEKVHIPANVIAFISIKASIKFQGLVNISGFHVDPGYHSHLKFSVYNAGTETVPLEVGRPTFLIWFADLDQPTDDPYDKPHEHVKQDGITGKDRVRMKIPVPSPTALDQRLRSLESRWKNFVFIAKYFVLPTLAAVLAGIVIWALARAFPDNGVSRELREILRCLGSERSQETQLAYPRPSSTPVSEVPTKTPTPPVETATPSPAATQNASVSPKPSVNVRGSQRPHP